MSEIHSQALTQVHTRPINPWVLHLQKLGLELKCPVCLDFFSKPALLPCDHIFCSSCVPKSVLCGSECPLCQAPYFGQDIRNAPYMENVVNIYRSLDASFSMQMLSSDHGRGSETNQFSTKTNFPNKLTESLIGSSPAANSIFGMSGFSLMGNKRVQVSNNVSVMANMERGSGFAISNLRSENHVPDFQTCGGRPSSVTNEQTRGTKQEQHEAVDVDMNQVELSPDSPLSSGVSKGCSEDSTEKRPFKKSFKRSVDKFAAQGIDESSDMHLKKQRQSNECLNEMHASQSPHFTCKDMQDSTSGDGAQLNDSSSLINFKCAFCHTWKITEPSGPMLHFADGREVFGSKAAHSKVIHVHRSCIEWAPQIYYENDSVVKNLDKELSRSGKIKCTSCKLTGAALGCYVKSCRRSYHAPCAFGIEECRLDEGEFLMLCPYHTSHKFPSEKSKKSSTKKSTASTQNISEEKNVPEFDFWATSPTGAKQWVLCGSALSADEKLMLVKFGKICGATVTKTWNSKVTHVVAATDANGACSRTLKVLMAILNGRWILTTDWIKACMQAKRPIDEEPYEIGLDNHGCCHGPKTGRLRALDNARPLFGSLKFFFSGDFVPAYKHDIQDLIIAAGGTILQSPEQLSHHEQSSSSGTVIIYNHDASMGTEDANEVLLRKREAVRLAFESESKVIAHTWILDSIAAAELLPFAESSIEPHLTQ